MMGEPSEDEMVRASAALIPFVRRWDLPLNPENVNELAYAVSLHARSTLPIDEIPAAVERQIDEHEEQHRQMLDAMAEAADRARNERLG